MRGTQYQVTDASLARAVRLACAKPGKLGIEQIARRAAVSLYSWRPANASVPVTIVTGNSAPHVRGHSFWKTQFNNGRGFSRILYTPSTQRIVVGADWHPFD